MGPIIQVWSAWASDPQVRLAGSSGGTLTALAAWLAETGEATHTIGARADRDNPRRTVSVQITTREAAIASAGSRYAPASNCEAAGALRDSAFIGKPCEVSALRADPAAAGNPLLLSFYCAGTPSQHATESLAEQLGVPRDERIRDLWYRGHGWPGKFTVTRADQTTVATSYEQSWGEHLGRAVQWRCKICPDGVGESSDITAADLWQADERGYPDFTEGAGVSALIARTERGFDVITRAIAAGVLVATPIEINELAAIQPYQRQRRQTLLGRLAGTVAAGGVIPRFTGFTLARLALPRLREVIRVARGTYRRRRALGGHR
jgi:coenzyme F420 hydrogenase subunit beta